MRNTFLQRKYPQDAVQADPLRKRSFAQPLTENYSRIHGPRTAAASLTHSATGTA
jgi:hypothetical protein